MSSLSYQIVGLRWDKMKQDGFSCIFLSTPLIASTLSSSKGVINWNKWGDAVQSADLEITWQFCGR